MTKTVESYPYTFDPDACRTCPGRCCNGESGNIWVTKKEIEIIAGHLEMETTRFIKDYLRKIGYRFTIKELKKEDNYACVFFDTRKNGCLIYTVRPEQCRTFPFWPYYRTHVCELLEECPGVIAQSDGPTPQKKV